MTDPEELLQMLQARDPLFVTGAVKAAQLAGKKKKTLPKEPDWGVCNSEDACVVCDLVDDIVCTGKDDFECGGPTQDTPWCGVFDVSEMCETVEDVEIG